ncbi:MAG: 3-oxoacyl-[acyl-carrier-protein] synthase, partial [Pseudonocardiales bacterium]|nr:3-oxoacyl-[acyl-carrier-protein] synthase [Pseudonocardiales bacterium]
MTRAGKSLRLIPAAPGARILGWGSSQPDHIVTNDDLAKRVDTNDQWIRERVGIVSRRIADKDTLLVDMAADAGSKAIADAGLGPADVDTVLVATCTMPNPIPNAAAQVAHKIGISAPGAFDLNAACAGFCYGMGMASDLI